MTPVTVKQGTGPIVLGMPHTGTFVPDEVAAKLNDTGRELADTDWHIDRLFDGVLSDVTTVTANFHRYVIDANRDPQGVSLYPGQNTTTLIPMTDFEGAQIWNTAPTRDDIQSRRAAFHAPYHIALKAELERVRGLHGVAILFDCHSIRSKIPYLFDGVLPDLNIGTNQGVTCASSIQEATRAVCEAAEGYTSVLNGRFTGGWSTRHYGHPQDGIHAIQLELTQSSYLSEETAPWTYDESKSAALRPHLTSILTELAALAPTLGGTR